MHPGDHGFVNYDLRTYYDVSQKRVSSLFTARHILNQVTVWVRLRDGVRVLVGVMYVWVRRAVKVMTPFSEI